MSNLSQSVLNPSKKMLIYGTIIFTALFGMILGASIVSGFVSADGGDNTSVDSEKTEINSEKGRRQLTTKDITERVKNAVDAGKITQEQADERILAWKNYQGKRSFHKNSMPAPHREAKLKALVDAGDITQEEADQKLLALKNYQGEKSFHKNSMPAPDWEAKLKALVDAGDITQEEADQKLEATQSK